MSNIDFTAIPSPNVQLTLRPSVSQLRLGVGGRVYLLKGKDAEIVFKSIEEHCDEDVVKEWHVGKYDVTVRTYPNPYSGTTKVKALVSFPYEAPLYDIVEGRRESAGTMKGVKTVQASIHVED